MPAFSDGLVRLPTRQLPMLRLRHLLSDLHEDVPALDIAACGRVATITGYTEWVGAGEATVTLGWDWELRCDGGRIHWSRLGLPYSNVVLLDHACRELRWQQNLRSLADFIDALPWAESMLSAVAARHVRC
jgi:hypothetical protein